MLVIFTQTTVQRHPMLFYQELIKKKLKKDYII